MAVHDCSMQPPSLRLRIPLVHMHVECSMDGKNSNITSCQPLTSLNTSRAEFFTMSGSLSLSQIWLISLLAACICLSLPVWRLCSFISMLN